MSVSLQILTERFIIARCVTWAHHSMAENPYRVNTACQQLCQQRDKALRKCGSLQEVWVGALVQCAGLKRVDDPRHNAKSSIEFIGGVGKRAQLQP